MMAGASDHDWPGELVASGEPLREDGELARRQGGESRFVDEDGHVGAVALHHFDVLTSRGQVHEQPLPGQLRLSQALHHAPGGRR